MSDPDECVVEGARVKWENEQLNAEGERLEKALLIENESKKHSAED